MSCRPLDVSRKPTYIRENAGDVFSISVTSSGQDGGRSTYKCTLLQTRQKWNNTKRNLQVGDIVLVKEDLTKRNEWKLALVDAVQHSSDGVVRTVLIRQGTLKYVRPVNKLVLVLGNEV